MHICHLNSTSLRDIERCAQLIAVAQQHGLKITVEAYPYGAAFEDRATFAAPTHPSVGVRHLLVGGTALIRDGHLDTAVRPGAAVRGTRR